MFSSNFIEGQSSNVGELTNVKLKDDNFHAMKTILQILHYHRDSELELITAEELACLAIHCDKYDCRTALQPWTFYWFRNLGSCFQSSEELSFLLLAAYKFDTRELFAKVSVMALKQLTLEYPTKWYDHEMLSLIPETVSGMSFYLFQNFTIGSKVT